jgi:hypothetical protein
VQLTPSPVVGGNKVSGSVTLPSPAPARGATVTVTTSSVAIAPFQDPSGATSTVASLSVVVPEGQTVGRFRLLPVGVAAPTTITISASLNGETTNVTLVVLPASVAAISFAPVVITGGQSTTGTIQLDGSAPPTTPLTVGLASTVAAGATTVSVPASVTIKAGDLSATFGVSTVPVTSRADAVVTATLGSAKSAAFAILPPRPTAVQLTPARVTGGSQSTGVVALSGPAPAGGVTVTLSSSTPSATLPTSVAVPAGVDRQSFAVSTTPVATSTRATIGARVANQTNVVQDAPVTTILVIDPPPVPASISLARTVAIGGTSLNGTVVLNGVAPAGGVLVALAASNDAASVPAQLTVPAGSDRQQFQVNTRPVTPNGQVTISARRPAATVQSTSTASPDGSTNTIVLPEPSPATAALTVLEPPRVQAITVQPSTATGGSAVTVTVTYAPTTSPLTAEMVSTYVGGTSFHTDHPETFLLPTRPPVGSITTSLVATGGFTATVSSPTAVPSAAQTISVTAVVTTSSKATTLVVQPPALPIGSFTLRPTTVTAGTNITATIVLSSATTTTQTVLLTTDHPEVVTVPASIVVQPGPGATISLSTRRVSTQTAAAITARVGTQSVSVKVQIVP